jgi:transposase
MVFGTMNGTKPRRTKAELEARRRLAVRKVNEGRSQKDVADFLGVHPVTVAKWVAAYRASGDDGLAARPTPGRPRFLTPDQEAQVLAWLVRKPTAFGFRTDLWTAARVAQLIRERFGVAYHPNYLREWLSNRDHSPQKPARRPRQRNPVEIDRWLSDDYPLLEKKSGRTTPTSC